jgi:osmoprotectant transport system ATP-binding protein
VVRARLQREFAAILSRLGKTVIMVTHDIDEAIRMGDRVAVMRDGRIAQHDSPDRLLLAPADPFVANFVGSDRALKRLALVRAGDAAQPGPTPAGLPSVPPDATLADALSALLAAGGEAVAVEGSGVVTLSALRERAATTEA